MEVIDVSIEVKDIKISYDQNTIIERVSFQVEQGEFYTLLGKSGIGKSSILRAISGLIPLDKGEIIINDLDITHLPVDQRNIAMIFQKTLLFPHLNVFENIAFGLKMHHWNKHDIQKRVTDLLNIFQISELVTRMPIEISGGQQQRVAIARSIALKQKILFMDEPFSSLDPYLKEEMYALLEDIRKKLDLTIIFVTHDVKEALILSDRIGYLSRGTLIQQGNPNDLYNYPESKELAEFLDPVNWVEGKVESNLFSCSFGDVDLPINRKFDKGKCQMLLRPHDLSLLKEHGFQGKTKTGSSIDGFIFSESFEVLFSERKGKETITVISSHGEELTVIQQDNMNFIKGETVYLQVLNPYMHIISMDDFNISSISTHTYHPIPQ
jgi:putative spermidine/putrescine transport system ATP-binding protein